MELNQNQEDSSGQYIFKTGPKMKISLFYKLYAKKLVSFFVILSLFLVIPVNAEANLISRITGMMGISTQAAEPEEEFGTDFFYNSQNIPLLESSVNQDVEAPAGGNIVIVDGTAIVPNMGLIGSGIENEPSREIMIYEVRQNDTLSQIAEMFDVSSNTIRWENNISGSTIKVGQKLRILPVTGVKHIIKKGDTLDGIAKKYDAESEDMLIFNGIEKGDVLKAGDIIFVPNGIIKPATSSSSSTPSTSSSSSATTNTNRVVSGYYMRPALGPVTSPYGSRWGAFHYGIDIGNKRGTTVVAAASGKVVAVVSYCKEGNSSCGGKYGNYVTIQHSNGQKTRYAHLQGVSVSVGQTVSQGQKVGTIGNTGRSTGPHLHFEIENSNGSKMKPPF